MVSDVVRWTADALLSAGAFLRAHQSSAGGWPYGSGSFCHVEPTVLALLALGFHDTCGSTTHCDAANAAVVSDGLSWLVGQLSRAGAVVLPEDPGNPHWSTALVVIAAARLCRWEGKWEHSVQFLLDWEAVVTDADPAIPLNSELRGWPWYPGSFSWVIPTAHALLALRVAGYGDELRVSEGEALLLDRMCVGGGWNYGNREVLGQVLLPMTDTTAWALLALQQCTSAGEAVIQGMNILNREVRQHPSSQSLALALLCNDVYGYPVDELASLLAGRQMSDGSWQHQIHLTSLAMLALRATLGGGNVFAL